MNMKHRL